MVRTLAALADEVGSVPSTQVGWPQPPGTLARGAPKFSFGLPIHMPDTHTDIYRIFFFNLKKAQGLF